jgi:hypothetical protein
MKKLLLFVLLAVGIPAVSSAQSIIAAWDFQTTSEAGTAVAASPNTPKTILANWGVQAGSAGGATLYLNGTRGSSDWFVPATGSTNTELNAFGGTALNARDGMSTVTTSPAALAFLGGLATNSVYAGNGKAAVFAFTMANLKDLQITYASQRTTTGFTSQTWAYSANGTTWTNFATISNLAASFQDTGVINLGTLAGLNGASTAFVRVTFDGATASAGNNRLDNVVFEAVAIPEPATYAAILGIAVLGGAALARRRQLRK